MKSCILDTSVCVDLHHGGLLESVLQLGFTFVLPDVIIAELTDPEGTLFVNLGYESMPLTGVEVARITVYQAKYPKLSVKDIFALLCSMKVSGILLTGDSDLRDAGRNEKLEVHGVLWILDQLVDSEIMASKEAKLALEQMLVNKARLPKSDCEIRLAKWGKGDE